jgi:hypothetical protein
VPQITIDPLGGGLIGIIFLDTVSLVLRDLKAGISNLINLVYLVMHELAVLHVAAGV